MGRRAVVRTLGTRWTQRESRSVGAVLIAASRDEAVWSRAAFCASGSTDAGPAGRRVRAAARARDQLVLRKLIFCSVQPVREPSQTLLESALFSKIVRTPALRAVGVAVLVRSAMCGSYGKRALGRRRVRRSALSAC